MTKYKLSDIQEKDICAKYLSGQTLKEIGIIFNVSFSTVRNILKRHNINTSARKHNYQDIVNNYLFGLTITEIAKKLQVSIGTISRVLKINSISIRPRLQGKDHPLWKGNYKDKEGYIIDTNTNSKQHRLYMETIIGRKLELWECVHHINGNKTDNDISNLVIMPMREHTRFHSFLYSRGLETSKQNLETYARLEFQFYYRFTKKDFMKHSNITKIEKPKIQKPKCIISGCENERYGNRLCNKHYQRKRAKERGYWLSGGGRKAKIYIK